MSLARELARQGRAGLVRSSEALEVRQVWAGNFGLRRPISLNTESRKLSAARLADSVTISGLLVPYGKISSYWPDGGQQMVFRRGCFSASLASENLLVLHGDNPCQVLGRSGAKTAVFFEDATGLQVECDPPDSYFANDLMVSVDRGDVDQMAATFGILKSSIGNQDGQKVLVIEQAQLYYASIGPFPMFTDPSSARVTDKNQLAIGSNYTGSFEGDE
jgi:HK97 family phage prohead protease